MYWGSFRQERRCCSWSRAMLGYAILGVWTAGHHHHHHPTHHHHHQQYHHHHLQAHEWGDSMTCRIAIVWCLWPAALWIKERHLTEPEFQQMGLLGSVAGIEGIPLAMAMVWKISCPSLGTPLKEDNDQAQISLPDLFGKSIWIWMEFFRSSFYLSMQCKLAWEFFAGKLLYSVDFNDCFIFWCLVIWQMTL